MSVSRLLRTYDAVGLGVLLTLAALLFGLGSLLAAPLPAAGLAGLAVALMLVILVLGRRALRRQFQLVQADRDIMLANAHRDALTGAFTRSYFLSRLREDVKHDADFSMGYMQIDMDHLKVLNDSGGHSAGDAALVHLITTVNRILPGAMGAGWAATNSALRSAASTANRPCGGWATRF